MKQLQNNGIILDIHHLCIVSLVSGNKKQGEVDSLYERTLYILRISDTVQQFFSL